jgi:hypothetical protein
MGTSPTWATGGPEAGGGSPLPHPAAKAHSNTTSSDVAAVAHAAFRERGRTGPGSRDLEPGTVRKFDLARMH